MMFGRRFERGTLTRAASRVKPFGFASWTTMAKSEKLAPLARRACASCPNASSLDSLREAGCGTPCALYLRYVASQSRKVLYQSSLFCGFWIQWPSSGKSSSFEGTPCR